ncbi:hypothetical protein B0H13DRAFT_106158 [Mycena leptocephala]|nr:hypothetical protein B0H13DRAFT_106158 [Mycena leptocephala]
MEARVLLSLVSHGPGCTLSYGGSRLVLLIAHAKFVPHRYTAVPAQSTYRCPAPIEKTKTRDFNPARCLEKSDPEPVTALDIWHGCRMCMAASRAGCIRRRRRGGTRIRVVPHAHGSRGMHLTSIHGERETTSFVCLCSSHTRDAVLSLVRCRFPPRHHCARSEDEDENEPRVSSASRSGLVPLLDCSLSAPDAHALSPTSAPPTCGEMRAQR